MAGTIVVLYHDSLMAKGLSLLLAQQGLSAIGIDLRSADPAQVMATSVGPGDLLLLDRSDGALRPAGALERLLSQATEVVVMLLDPDENRTEIYFKKQITVAGLEQLLGVLRAWCRQGSLPWLQQIP